MGMPPARRAVTRRGSLPDGAVPALQDHAAPGQSRPPRRAGGGGGHADRCCRRGPGWAPASRRCRSTARSGSDSCCACSRPPRRCWRRWRPRQPGSCRAGLGLGTCFQAVPFQCRIRVLPAVGPSVGADRPGVAGGGGGHAADSAPPSGPGWAPASRRCRSSAGSASAVRWCWQHGQPTAQALRAEVAATPERLLPPGARAGHLLPRGAVPVQDQGLAAGAWPLLAQPTAQALLAEVAATPDRALPPARGRAGHLLPGGAVPVQDQRLARRAAGCSRPPRRCWRRWRPRR